MFKLKLNNFIKLKKKTFSIIYNKKVLVMWESCKPNDIISFFSVGGSLLVFFWQKKAVFQLIFTLLQLIGLLPKNIKQNTAEAVLYDYG